MNRLTTLSLSCNFSDFAQSYIGSSNRAELIQGLNDSFGCCNSTWVNITDDTLDNFMCGWVEIYIEKTDEDREVALDSLHLYIAPDNRKDIEIDCDCLNAGQLLKDIIDRVS